MSGYRLSTGRLIIFFPLHLLLLWLTEFCRNRYVSGAVLCRLSSARGMDTLCRGQVPEWANMPCV